MSSLSAATRVTSLSSHEYEVNLPHDWCIGSVPHGGYVTSCFLSVAAAHFAGTLSKQGQPHAISLHLEFLRRTETGPATFKVNDVKLGRMTSTIHLQLSQNGRQEVAGYITHSNIASESGPSLDTKWRLDPSPPQVDLTVLKAGHDQQWQERRRMPFSEFRKAATQVRWFFPRDGQPHKGMADQWMALTNGERFTNESLGLVVDMFPQVIETYRSDTDPYSVEAEEAGIDTETEAKQRGIAKYWYPTLLLNLDVKKTLPEEGVEFLFVRTRAKQIRNGRYDLEIVVQDEVGDLVALSHHICMILPASRNLAKRSDGNASSKL